MPVSRDFLVDIDVLWLTRTNVQVVALVANLVHFRKAPFRNFAALLESTRVSRYPTADSRSHGLRTLVVIVRVRNGHGRLTCQKFVSTPGQVHRNSPESNSVGLTSETTLQNQADFQFRPPSNTRLCAERHQKVRALTRRHRHRCAESLTDTRKQQCDKSVAQRKHHLNPPIFFPPFASKP